MKNLSQLLQAEETEDRIECVAKLRPIESVNITSYALDKAYAYANIVSRISRRSTMECGGYLIAPKGQNNIIATDAFLARDQDVSEGLFRIWPKDVIAAGREIDKMGCRVLGWWHSHGCLDTFFSETDDNGQRTVLNGIAPINYITVTREVKAKNLQAITVDDQQFLFDPEKPSRKYRLGGEAKINSLDIIDEKRVGFAYGLVVNTHLVRKPYLEVAVRDFCTECNNVHDISYRTGGVIFNTAEKKINEEELRKEVIDRVKIRNIFDFGIFRKSYGGDQASSRKEKGKVEKTSDRLYGNVIESFSPKKIEYKQSKDRNETDVIDLTEKIKEDGSKDGKD